MIRVLGGVLKLRYRKIWKLKEIEEYDSLFPEISKKKAQINGLRMKEGNDCRFLLEYEKPR